MLPWVRPILLRLPQLPAAMPHALLLAGQAGLGKRTTALYLAHAILCETARPSLEACGSCIACKLIDAGTHPDLRSVEIGQDDAEESAISPDDTPTHPKKPSRLIAVDRIRALNEFVASTAYRGQSKVILISPAEAMHPSASNALLKMLEEPSRGTHFLLVSHQADRLLPTIRSRCFRVDFPVPPAAESMQWLGEQGGERGPLLALAQSSYAPLAARECGDDAGFWEQRKALLDLFAEPDFDPLAAAQRAEGLDAPVIARLLLQWAYDLLALISGTDLRYHLDYRNALGHLARKLEPHLIIAWHDAVLQYARASEHPLNKRLALESLFSGYPAYKARS